MEIEAHKQTKAASNAKMGSRAMTYAPKRVYIGSSMRISWGKAQNTAKIITDTHQSGKLVRHFVYLQNRIDEQTRCHQYVTLVLTDIICPQIIWRQIKHIQFKKDCQYYCLFPGANHAKQPVRALLLIGTFRMRKLVNNPGFKLVFIFLIG